MQIPDPQKAGRMLGVVAHTTPSVNGKENQ